MSNIYVLYHAGCNDGFGAAWIAHKHLGDAQDGRRVRYLPQSYGGEPPRMGPGSRIYILDFSYPLETMLELHRQHESVILLDHHETARDALEGRVPDCHFDLERSGVTIAWEYWGSGFSTNEGELLARYIEDRILGIGVQHERGRVAGRMGNRTCGAGSCRTPGRYRPRWTPTRRGSECGTGWTWRPWLGRAREFCGTSGRRSRTWPAWPRSRNWPDTGSPW